jgi:hypothetical protein
MDVVLQPIGRYWVQFGILHNTRLCMSHMSNVVLLGKVKENLNMNLVEVPLPSTTDIHKLVNNQ